jgi:hypothetical protein
MDVSAQEGASVRRRPGFRRAGTAWRRSAAASLRGLLVLLFAVPAAVSAQTNVVIVSGLGGQPAYTSQFTALSEALATAANERAALPESSITWLGEEPASRSRWFRGQSTRANIESVLRRLAARPVGEQLVLVLIGHGSGEGPNTRISLPGADLTAADFARLLDAFGKRPVAFVNLTSASGDMLPVLAAPSRVVLTATKSAFERNETQFARFFVDAFAKDGADTDKDGRVSLAEAFTFADAEVKRFYESAGRLATEHAQLADSDQLARRFFLSPGTAARAGGNPQLAALHAQKDSLDERVRVLRNRKESMPADEYERELERLLVALAEKTLEIRRLEKGGNP